MSVSRRLVLSVRPSAVISSETNSSSSLSGLGATDDDDAGSTSTPIVVIRSGSRDTANVPAATADELARYGNGIRPVHHHHYHRRRRRRRRRKLHLNKVVAATHRYTTFNMLFNPEKKLLKCTKICTVTSKG